MIKKRLKIQLVKLQVMYDFKIYFFCNKIYQHQIYMKYFSYTICKYRINELIIGGIYCLHIFIEQDILLKICDNILVCLNNNIF